MNKPNQKGFAPVVLIVIIVAVLAVGIGGYFVFLHKTCSEEAITFSNGQQRNCFTYFEMLRGGPTPWPALTSSLSPIPSATLGETAGWKTYTNSEYGFEFKYSNNLITSETKGSSNYEKRFTNIRIDTAANIKLLKSAEGTEGIQTFLDIDGHEPSSKPASACDDSYTSSKVTMSSVLVTKCIGQSMFGPGSMYIEFTKDRVIYYTIKSDKYLDNDRDLIDQILSTFKFTTTASVSPISTSSPNKNCGSFCAPSDCGTGYHWKPNGYSAGDTVKGSCEPN